MSEAIRVKTLDGLYDERAEALTCDLNDRKPHGRWWRRSCAWINASLHWSQHGRLGDGSYIGLECFGHQGFPAWGMSSGGIRFCRHCKRIACIHQWAELHIYEIAMSAYYATCAEIGICRLCHLRILRQTWGSSRPSSEAQILINTVAAELGRPAVGLGGGYGSGWLYEFPAVVSELLDRHGEEAARTYIRRALMAGDCQSAFDAIHGAPSVR